MATAAALREAEQPDRRVGRDGVEPVEQAVPRHPSRAPDRGSRGPRSGTTSSPGAGQGGASGARSGGHVERRGQVAARGRTGRARRRRSRAAARAAACPDALAAARTRARRRSRAAGWRHVIHHASCARTPPDECAAHGCRPSRQGYTGDMPVRTPDPDPNERDDDGTPRDPLGGIGASFGRGGSSARATARSARRRPPAPRIPAG